jgi:hypothetical protein
MTRETFGDGEFREDGHFRGNLIPVAEKAIISSQWAISGCEVELQEIFNLPRSAV